MAEILIAGGGIAGSALAILLGRNGRTVELFDRAKFPRDKPCGEGVMPAGVAVLERLGLLETVGGMPFQGIRYHFGGRVLEGKFPGKPGYGLAQRRTVLDRVLFEEAARTQGVSAHSGTRVDRPIVENGRVTGLLVEGIRRYGGLVVAADGARSTIRRSLGLDLAPRRRRIGVRIHYQLAERQEMSPFVEVFVTPRCELYLAPLPGHQVLLAALTDEKAIDGAFPSLFEDWWRSHPALADRLNRAVPTSSLRGAFPLAVRARRGIGPGFVLLGDAAGFIDPITGGGMAQALTTAELLASSMPRHLDSDESWLREFDQCRARMLRHYHLLTHAMLWLSGHRVIAGPILSLARAAPSFFSRLLDHVHPVRLVADPSAPR